MNRLYITLLLTLTVLGCYGQNIRSNSASFKRDLRERNSPNIRPDLSGNKPTRQSRKPEGCQKPSKQDTVYAIQTAKQHGWFIPLGVLTKEQTRHRYSSVMFTGKNKRGHWTKIETINAYGGHSKGLFLPYILRNGSVDDSANKEWLERLEGNCIFEMIADPQGDNVIQERAYDENHNLLYVYSRTPIGPDETGRNQYIGSYKDMYGLPAEMRKTEGHTYGTIVKITEDEWGNDHIIEYLDSKGVNKLNADSVHCSVRIYDKYGHELRFGSQNEKGEYVIDSWGNCGVIQTWNDDHTIASAIYTNTNWQPMKMPSEKANEKCGIIKVLYKYDDYKRIIETSFVDENNNPMTNVYGCHKITSEYDDNGNIIKQTGYNLKGELSPITISGTAIENYVYDQYGRMTYASFFDKKQKPCRTEGYLSKIKREYDEEGNEVLVENYSAETGGEKLCYQMISKPNYKYTLWNDGTSRIDSLDSKGRLLFSAYFKHDGTPNFSNVNGYHKEVNIYNDSGYRTYYTSKKFDEKGLLIGSIAYCINDLDSISHLEKRWNYNANGVLIQTYIRRWDKDFNWPIAEMDMNEFGVICRNGGTANTRYYIAEVPYTHKRSFSFFVARDEFNEPDYINENGNVYYYRKMVRKKSVYYDENGIEIIDFPSFINQCPKIMTIEVTDSSAYALGLRDNDIIIAYGDYAVNLDSVVSYLTFKQEWTIRSVIDATKEKRMVVFRITDASKNEYGLYEIKGLKGTCSELGFLPHIRYLTDKQLNRIKASVDKEMKSQKPIVTYNDLKKTNNKGGSNYVLLAYTEMYRSQRNEPYPKQVTDPSILLGACIKDRNLKWTKENGSSSESFETMLASRTANATKYPIQDFFMTRDGKSMRHLILEERAVFTNWSDVYISDEDYRQISALYDNALDSINAIMKQRNLKNQKNFLGSWISQPNDSLRYAPKAFFSLSKDGKCEGQIVNYGQIHFSEGDAVYKVVSNLIGKWNNSDNWLFVYPENDSIKLSCVDLLGAESDDLRQRAVDYMNSICESNKMNLLKRMTYDDNKIDVDFYDVSINKNTFEAKLPSGKTIVFNKTKEKIDILAEASGAENDGMSGEEINAIDESCPYIGSWQCKLPGVEKSNVEFELSQSGNLEIELFAVGNQAMNDSCSVDMIFDINVKGSWKPTENGMRFNIDEEKINIDTDFVLHGVDDSKKVKMLTNMKEEFNSLKHEMGLSLLKGFMNEMVVTEVDTAKMVMNGNLLTRTPIQISSVIGRIEGDTGYLVEKGYTGLFVILEWCDWNCRYGIDEFREEFNKQKDNKKHIMLLPVETKDGKDVFKDIIELDVSNGLLGIRLMDQNVGRIYYKYNVLNRYKEHKKSKEY